MTADAYGFVTLESDSQLWTTLEKIWQGEHRPGYVMRGQTCYSVYLTNGVPKFKEMVDKNMYNDTSFSS